MRLTKSVITALLKVAFVLAIFASLLCSGKLDVGHVFSARSDWSLIRMAFGVVALSMFLLSVRYWYVVRCIHIKLGLFESFRIGFIAFLFTNCAFGALSGEIIRATYTVPFAEKKSHVLSAIMFDRFIGVLSLTTLCVAGLTLNRVAVSELWFHVVKGVIFLFFSFSWQALFSLFFIRLLGSRLGTGASFALMLGVCCLGLALFAGDNDFSGQIVFGWAGGAMFMGYLAYTTVLLAIIRKIGSQPDAQVGMPVGAGRKIIARVESVLRSCLLFIGRPRVFVVTLAMALSAHFLYVVALLVIVMALSGNGSFYLSEGVLAAPLTFLMNLFPFPGAGAGVNEASYGYFMGKLAGVDSTIAVGGYFLFRCMLIALSLVGVPLFLMRKKSPAKLAVGDELESDNLLK